MSLAARLIRALFQPLSLAVFGLGLRFVPSDTPRSTLSGVDWPLYAGVIAGFWAQMAGWRGLQPSAALAALSYVVLSIGFGLIYELSLTVDGSGWGGMHPDTRTSFVLAIGDYAMMALCFVAAIRWFGLTAAQLFWLSFGASMTEGAVFTGVLWQIPPLWMPLFLAYYGLAYATFLVLPALLVDPRRMWRGEAQGRVNPLTLLAAGFAVAFAIRIFWGLVYGPFVTDLFSLLPPVA